METEIKDIFKRMSTEFTFKDFCYELVTHGIESLENLDHDMKLMSCVSYICDGGDDYCADVVVSRESVSTYFIKSLICVNEEEARNIGIDIVCNKLEFAEYRFQEIRNHYLNMLEPYSGWAMAPTEDGPSVYGEL